MRLISMVWNPTLDEIKKELQREKPDRIWDFDDPALTNALNKARSEGYKEGQKDTAKQIFADLEQAAWQQIEPDKLTQFYKEFSEAKDEQAALEIAKKYSVIGFSTEKYDSIQKKYGVLK